MGSLVETLDFEDLSAAAATRGHCYINNVKFYDFLSHDFLHLYFVLLKY